MSIQYLRTRTRTTSIRFVTQILLSSSILLLLLVTTLPTSTEAAMRLVVQKVKSASVTVDEKIISSIGPGIVALVGLHENDSTDDLQHCCKRLLGCKLWANENGALWRQGVKQKNFEVLCVSQFTLYGTITKKNQPDYKLAMKSIQAQQMYNEFLDLLKSSYENDKIKDGQFGAMMDVSLINDGPVTIIIESNDYNNNNNDKDKNENSSSNAESSSKQEKQQQEKQSISKQTTKKSENEMKTKKNKEEEGDDASSAPVPPVPPPPTSTGTATGTNTSSSTTTTKSSS